MDGLIHAIQQVSVIALLSPSRIDENVIVFWSVVHRPPDGIIKSREDLSACGVGGIIYWIINRVGE